MFPVHKLLLLCLTTAMTAGPALGQDFETPAGDAELANMRGGFMLPNGVDVAVAVRSDTMVNGRLVLRSVYTINDSKNLSLFVPRVDEGGVAVTPAGKTIQIAAGDGSDRIVMHGAGLANGSHVTMSFGRGGSAAPDNSNLQKVNLANGSAVVPGGTIHLEEANRNSRATYAADGISSTHIFGDAFGVITTNRASDVTIDVMTAIDIDLANLGPDVIGSSLLQVEGLALEATGALVRPGG